MYEKKSSQCVMDFFKRHSSLAANNKHSTLGRAIKRRLTSLDTLSASSKQPQKIQKNFLNDPSAGSPTETLLRLLVPLNDQV